MAKIEEETLRLGVVSQAMYVELGKHVTRSKDAETAIKGLVIGFALRHTNSKKDAMRLVSEMHVSILGAMDKLTQEEITEALEERMN